MAHERQPPSAAFASLSLPHPHPHDTMRIASQADLHPPVRPSSSSLSPPTLTSIPTSTQPSSSSSPLPPAAHVKPMDFVEDFVEEGDIDGDGDGEEDNLSDEASIEDPDEAQAALQPAISAAASHLTSAQTPAAEKAAALERIPTGGYFGGIVVDEDDEDDDDEDDDGHAHDELDANQSLSPSDPIPRLPNEMKTATTMDRRDSQVYYSRPPPLHHHDRQQQPSPEQLPIIPTPWTVDDAPKPFIAGKDSPRTRQTKGLLESAFGPTRQRRSPSVGQEAFKRLQKAFPSFGGHSSFLPSLPASFLSNFTGDKQQPSNHTPSKLGAPARPRSMTLLPRSTASSSNLAPPAPVAGHSPASERLDKHSPLPNTVLKSPSAMSRLRPPMLRRVTSDESMLYHSLSRQSSLGDDNKFHDVREMVNIRFMAIKDSLPDVPNFKMPSLARLHAASRMPSMSLNGLFSSASDDHSSSRQVFGAGRQTHSSSKPCVPAPGKPSSATSAIDGVLERLTGDLVILGGYRGSVLRSAEPPHQQLWAPVKLGFNMRKANLEVGLEDGDEETMEERITPSGMLKHVGPVDISRKLFKKLRSSPNARKGTLRVWDFGYDWRLSPALSSKKLQEFLAKLPSNLPGARHESRGALVIAHSLGGLITRHAVNQAPELFAGVLYAGVPQRCINILGPFRNGDAVLFNEKLLSAQVNFSIRTSFVLLPEDGFIFIDKKTGEPYPIDFFNADDWARWHLSPCVAPLLPPYNRDKQQGSVHSPLSSFFPYSLLKNKKSSDSDNQSNAAAAASAENQHAQYGAATLPSAPQPPPSSPPDTTTAAAAAAAEVDVAVAAAAAATTSDRERYMKYLRRTLTATRKFRSELAHLPEHESANAYPPHAVLYGKTIPTVYAAQVASREAIAYADAYDDLVFRPGDGVVLAREAMLPDGYAIVRSGRVSTERGHLTMLGDLPSVAKALEALLWGRQKGIGTGKRDDAQSR
ncbi:hypothetical protein E4U21_005293 [Claviceps maximensis]|nr:hypothetical protein E4U21_005293 [Claviceps maximensis]